MDCVFSPHKWCCDDVVVGWFLNVPATSYSVSQGRIWARMHHKVVGNFGSEADVRSLYYRRFRFNETSDVGACTHVRPAKQILTELRPRYVESEPDFSPMHTKFERLLSKSLTTLEVMKYYLVVHTGPAQTVYVLPHRGRSCKSSMLSQPVTVY